MSYWEQPGETDEWYTPKYVFDALGCEFDLDPANAAPGGGSVPCRERFGCDGLERPWLGFVWLNPPFGGRNGIVPWLERFAKHGNGVCLTPDRTSAPWFQKYAAKMDSLLFVTPKIKFIRPDGTQGRSPSSGTALMALGEKGTEALRRASPKLGLLVKPQGLFG